MSEKCEKTKNQPEVRTRPNDEVTEMNCPLFGVMTVQSLSAEGFKFREKLKLSHLPKQTFSDIKEKSVAYFWTNVRLLYLILGPTTL